MNRTAPRVEVTDPAWDISPQALAVIGTLARTYDAQRLRLIDLRRPGHFLSAPSPLRPLIFLEPAVTLDGAPVSASIVDAVVQAPTLTGGAVELPMPIGQDEFAAAEAGWWDALLGDVERRTGLAPRSIKVGLNPDASSELRAVFADRVA